MSLNLVRISFVANVLYNLKYLTDNVSRLLDYTSNIDG